jgi:hypothetical protein
VRRSEKVREGDEQKNEAEQSRAKRRMEKRRCGRTLPLDEVAHLGLSRKHCGRELSYCPELLLSVHLDEPPSTEKRRREVEIESRWCEFETKAVKTKAAVYFVSLVLPWRLISIMKLIMAASCAKRRGGDRSGNWRRRGDC